MAVVKRGIHFFVAVAVVGCATRGAKSRPDGGGGVPGQQDAAGGTGGTNGTGRFASHAGTGGAGLEGSGAAVYSTTFDLSRESLKGSRRLYLDLGKVLETERSVLQDAITVALPESIELQQHADAHRAFPCRHLLPNLMHGIGRDPVEGQQLGHPSTGETFPAGNVSAME